MLPLLLACCFIQLSSIAGESKEADDEDYSYEDEGKVEKASDKEKDGDRLVGGRISKTREYPFAIGWNVIGQKLSSHCTGSLITPTWFVSAAHCNEMMTSGDRDRTPEIREECVKATRAGGSHSFESNGQTYQVKCKWQKHKMKGMGAFEIVFLHKAWAWLGIDNFNDRATPGNEERELKRHLRHENSYRGGGDYGQFGGHDITLVELAAPISAKFPQACLPSPSFDDIRTDKDDSILVGYGLFLRDKGATCETNRFGSMKFHYCSKDEGAGSEACITGRPAPQPKECAKFFADPKTPNKVPDELEEIRITGLGDGKDIYCHPKVNPEDESFGWCKTMGNFYDIDNPRENQPGWGFCGKDCFTDPTEDNGGTFRTKPNVQIMPERLCARFLAKSLEASGDSYVKPQILCVGRKNPWKQEDWKAGGAGYRKVSSNSKPHRRYGMPFYVASKGTCQGDSGGPVFVDEGDHFVLTGAVSGGRGSLGKCGGINNPVHYVRIKKFTRWIVENIGASRTKVCWDKKFAGRLQRRRRRM